MYKKKLIALMLILTIMFAICGCNSNKETDASGSPSKEDSVIEIKEELFIAQTNDIYTNAEDYLGRTIKYQGLIEYSMYGEGEDSEQVIYVFRYGPGCCGNDGFAGFEVLWDGDMPQQSDWVEVEGVLQSYEDKDGNKFLQLKLDSLEVLDERGAELVTQ